MVIIFCIVWISCDNTPKNETVIYDEMSLKRIKKVAMTTFIASQDLFIGCYSEGDYIATSNSRPKLIQFLSKEFSATLHDTLLYNPVLAKRKIDFVSLRKVNENSYYRSLKGKYPLEKIAKNSKSSKPIKLINALPNFTVNIPIEKKDVFAKLANELGVDAILWIFCEFYLDVEVPSTVIFGKGRWIGEVLTEAKLISSNGKLIWEAKRFIKSVPKNAASQSVLERMIFNDESVSGETMLFLLHNAVEIAVDSLIISFEKAVLTKN